MFLHDELDEFVQVASFCHFSFSFLIVHSDHINLVAQLLTHFVEIILQKSTLVIHNHIDGFGACRTQIMFQRHRPIIGVDDIAWRLFKFGYPVCKLSRIANCSTQKHVFYLTRQHNDRLLPNDSSFLVPHIVHLVKYDPFDFSNHFASSINHASKDFSSHDETS